MTRNGNQTEAQSKGTGSTNSRTSLIGSEASSKPIGIRLFGLCFRFNSIQRKRNYYKALVLFLTFIAYATFHMGRRPLSIVKNVLNRDCSALPSHNSTEQAQILSDDLDAPKINGVTLDQNATQSQQFSVDNSCNWAPFDDDSTANQLLAVLDTSFLLTYALFMFVSGIIAERMNLRYCVTIGSILGGIALILFGIAYPLQVHSMTYFIVIQIFSGAVHSIGWPVVVTCVGKWFEQEKIGLIYGLWNSHTNVGNILGAAIAGFFVEKDWGLSFIVPGSIMIFVGILLFLFLVPSPQDVDLSPTTKEGSFEPAIVYTSNDLTPRSKDGMNNFVQVAAPKTKRKAVSFATALKIPGVMEYSMCLFFAKLVSYTFLYWLPRYITSSTSNNSEHSAYLSTSFDVGGVAGAILAGYLSDKFQASGTTCNAMLLLATPTMFLYQKFGSMSTMSNVGLLMLVGSLVNGPYCLITTAVSADLGSRIKDGQAMATVAAIIDGMGSVGAVVGPLIAGFFPSSGDWKEVFLMLILADIFASICLIRVTANEIKHKFFKSTTIVQGNQEQTSLNYC